MQTGHAGGCLFNCPMMKLSVQAAAAAPRRPARRGTDHWQTPDLCKAPPTTATVPPLRAGTLCLLQLLCLPKGKGRRGGGGVKRTEKRVSAPPPPPPPRSLSCCCSSFSARVSGCRTHTPESHRRRWSTQVCLFALHTYAHTHFQPLRDESWLPPPSPPPAPPPLFLPRVQ